MPVPRCQVSIKRLRIGMKLADYLLTEFVSPEMRKAKTAARNGFALALQDKLNEELPGCVVEQRGRFTLRVLAGNKGGESVYQIRVRANSMWIDKEGGMRVDISGSNDAMLSALACLVAHDGI